MSKQIVQIRGLGKQYHRNGSGRSGNLRDWLAGLGKRQPEDLFWALKDLDLSIGQGEILGILGRNGSGKSTLLKVLSRVTPPTTGSASLYGRVASLLEVGTGFHPELTGRENIYLNGAILGMTRQEVKAHFAAIVEFAGVSDFIEAKVKQYSSGMYVRLAFSVAAHLRTDILLVDEVLAVGDAEFQKKSLQKMNEVVRENGRTILFVSHNLGLVQQLCNRAIWLDKGVLAADGTTATTIQCYLQSINQQLGKEVGFDGPLGKTARLKAITINGQRASEDLYFSAATDLVICLQLDFSAGSKQTTFGLGIFRNGVRLATLYCIDPGNSNDDKHLIEFNIKKNQLTAGHYSFGFGGRWNDATESWFWTETLFGST